MDEVIIIKCGELILKGHNRKLFEDRLARNLKRALRSFGSMQIVRSQGNMCIVPMEQGVSMEAVKEKVKKVFGISKVAIAYVAEKDIDAIDQIVNEKLKQQLSQAKTFKVEAKRADKKFPLKSPDIAREIGGRVLKAYSHLKVDVKDPQVLVNVDVRDEGAYVYSQLEPGSGGMPTGTNGKATLLLSGGIDSPVAGWLMAKRGLMLDAVNFFSYPYTSERAKEKVVELARILSEYAGTIRLFIVPFTKIQLAIKERCPSDQLVIIMRRFMTRIAQRIAFENESSALITGESLGQVASQTMQSMVVTNAVAQMPMLRPLVGLDKEEIVAYARKIGTFETSILPYEDCCTIFVPKHPETKPKLERICQSEERLDIEGLIQEAMDGIEIIMI